ncbi:MAG: hypothetical protein CMH27_02775 [Micavibrio sp.]|nr:hypothetical protein [Micavibrio sp.]|tara:strand:- start:61 stop:2097 length:2037 start_codon:yes stop_codon:yes gene_type:complete
MKDQRKSTLRKAFDAVTAPARYVRDKIREHIGYDVAMKGWENDKPMDYPKLQSIKDVFSKHAKRLPFMIIMPSEAVEFAKDLSKAIAPDKNSPLLPRFKNDAFEQDLARFKPDPKRKERLQASTSLDTSRSFTGASFKLLSAYWAKAGIKEVSIGTALAALTLYCTYESVEVLKEFSYWGRDFNNFYVNAGGISDSVKTALVDTLKNGYGLDSYASVVDLIQSSLSGAEFNKEAMDLTSALADVRIRPEILQDVLSQTEQHFGDLSLSHFADGQNQDVLQSILDNANLSGDQQQEIIQSVQNGIDIQNATAQMIAKMQEEFSNLDLSNPPTPEQLEAIKTNMDMLLAGDVLNTGNVQQGTGYLFKKAPLEFCNMLGKFLMYALPASYTAQHLALRWQTWMTGKVTNEWMKYKAAYKLKFEHSSVDNPDQRVTENLEDITDFAINITTDGMQTGLTLAAFLPILSAMGSFNPAFLGGPDIQIDNFLTWSALGYAAFGTGIITAISYSLPKLGRQLQKTRGDHRATMLSVHSQPEQISLSAGEAREKEILKDQFRKVVDVDTKFITKRMQLMTANSVFANVGSYVPLVLAAPQYFAGIITYGDVTQAAGIFRRVESAFEFLKNNIPAAASFKADVDRMAQLIDGMELAKYETLEKEYYKRRQNPQDAPGQTAQQPAGPEL